LIWHAPSGESVGWRVVLASGVQEPLEGPGLLRSAGNGVAIIPRCVVSRLGAALVSEGVAVPSDDRLPAPIRFPFLKKLLEIACRFMYKISMS
jgi:hypothetical protein